MLFSCGVNCRIDGWIYGYCTGIVRTRLGNIGVCVCLSVCQYSWLSVCLCTLDSRANEISDVRGGTGGTQSAACVSEHSARCTASNFIMNIIHIC
jgi:hypothetical protein